MAVMYTISEHSIQIGWAFQVLLPRSFQVLGMEMVDGHPRLFVLGDRRGELENVEFETFQSGAEIPLDTVRFKEYLGNVCIPHLYGLGMLTYHLFGRRAGGAFTLPSPTRF